MRITVLGSCGGWPEPQRACSGFLVEHGDTRVAVDLGYGVLPRLLDALDSTSGDGLDAVVITHRHPLHPGRRAPPVLPTAAALLSRTRHGSGTSLTPAHQAEGAKPSTATSDIHRMLTSSLDSGDSA